MAIHTQRPWACYSNHVDEALLYMTSERGSVEFVTDGRRLEVKTER